MTHGYPFVESIKSALPLVDEFVVVIGRSRDDTLEKVKEIGDSKIRIIETAWNEKMQDRGYVYGQQKMIGLFNCTGDWALYLEGDEVFHEKSYDQIYGKMLGSLNDHRVEALYFDFLHFYGSVDTIGISGYRKAPRIIRNSIRSIAPDGLFFVVLDSNKKGRYPAAISGGAKIFHYGHARKASLNRQKLEDVGMFWGRSTTKFVDYSNCDPSMIRDFTGTHPTLMRDWILNCAEKELILDPNYKPNFRDYRNRMRFWLEERLNIEISKKHFSKLD